MDFDFRYLAPVSPLVQPFWVTRSGTAREFVSTAGTSSELVFTRQGNRVQVALVGPSTQARPAPVPQDAEFLGVPFAPGTFLSSLPPAHALNGGLTLPLASSRAFWLNGSAIPIPHEDELDAFVTRLLRRGELQHSDVVERVLKGLPLPASLRTVQRQFLHATGLSSRQFEQIRRASEAAQLLRQGQPIADVVLLCGYSDQPHLTRALRRYWGQTPAQLRASVVSVQDFSGPPG